MQLNLLAMLPSSKMDTDKAEAIVALGFPTVEPILPQIMEWVQDSNWPVARVFEPFLASIGAPIETHVRFVLDSNDSQWKYFVIQNIIGASSELKTIFASDLERLASNPTKVETNEQLDQIARTVLQNE